MGDCLCPYEVCSIHGDNTRRPCNATMPAHLYEPDDSAAAVLCRKSRGHDGDHSGTVNKPRIITWPPVAAASDVSGTPGGENQ